MLQDVSGRGTWSQTCFKMFLAFGQETLQDVWQMATNAFQDVSTRGTWSKKCFKMSLAEARMLQDVSGRGTWSKKCFKMSLTEALGARNASRCL